MNATPSTTRIVCFSAYAHNLRYTALVRGLRSIGCQVITSTPRGPGGSILELLLTLLPNCWLALTCRADLAAGFKPHPNVTLPLLIAKLRGIPTWLDVDDLDHAYREGWMSKLVELLQRPFPRWYSLVSYHNLKLREHLVRDRQVSPERLLRMEQGVDFGLFGEPVAPDRVQDLAARLGLEGKPVGVYTAHLNVASDLEPVMRTWQLVVHELPAAVLVVVGGGPMLGHFQRLAANLGLSGNIRFSGEVDHAEVPVYVAAADVAVLYLSRRLVNEYRCSLKLREYFAAGIKVASNDVGELKEYAQYTYQSTSSPAEFASVIVETLRTGGDGREAEAQRFAQSKLDWSALIRGVWPELQQRVGLAPRPGIG